MFDLNLFDITQFDLTSNNVSGGGGGITATGSVIYNNFSFDNLVDGEGFEVLDIPDVDNFPEWAHDTFVVPRENGVSLTDSYWRVKKVVVRIRINSTTALGATLLLRQMQEKLAVPQSVLVIEVDGVKTLYTATLDVAGTTVERKHKNIRNKILCTLTFSVYDSFGYGEDSQSVFLEAETVDELVNTWTNEGNAPQKPTTTIAFTTASGVSEVRFENLTTGALIRITESFTAGDVLVINHVDKEVYKNGGELLDYSGTFWALDAGVSQYGLYITSTSHTVDVTILSKINYYSR